MYTNLALFLVLILLAGLFIWLFIRSLISKRPVLKWLGMLFSGLFALLFLAVTVVAARGLSMLYLPRPAPQVNIQVQSSPDQVARGQHLAEALCKDCHTDNKQLPLGGSHTNLLAGTGMPLGSLYPSNLTPGGAVGQWTDADLFRALRYNVSPNGHTLLMPAQGVRMLSDEDAGAIIAFLRSQPPAQYTPPAPQPTLLLAIMMGAGIVDVTPQLSAAPIAAPPAVATADYGQYVVGIMGCKDCHGADLHGGRPPAPVGPDLAVVRGWTQDQFMAALRQGIAPGGVHLADTMPWKTFSGLNDVEIQAAYDYLHNLSVKPGK